MAYDDDGVSAADYAYTYTDALVDGVCRPITFLAYGGEMEWVSDGRTRTAEFETLLPRHESAPAPAHRARRERRLDRARCCATPTSAWRRCAPTVTPRAGGLVVAADKEHANALADRLIADHSGGGRRWSPPTTPAPPDGIDRFAARPSAGWCRC